MLQASKSSSPDIHCSKAWWGILLLSVIWIWKASLDFKGYILPLSVQSKNSGESAICIQKGSFTKLVGQKEGRKVSWGARLVRQSHPNAVGYMETRAPFLSSNQSDERKTRNTFWMAISCYFWYQTSFCIKCIFRRIFVRDYRTDKGILGFRKNTKFIVVNHFSFFQTLQLVPRSHAVDGCSQTNRSLMRCSSPIQLDQETK